MNTNSNTDTVSGRATRRTYPAHVYRPAFSRAWHFELIIGPILTGLIVIVAMDRSASWIEILSVAGHSVGYSVAVLLLLKGIEKVERLEADTPVVYDDAFTEDLIRHAA